jgi:hypothetical protein
MYLVANGSSREFYYQKPRSGMLDAGARPGSVLFRGEVKDGQYFGTAYIFNQHCGVIPFDVRGQFYENDERITLTGQAPRVGRNCRAYETYTSNLEFKRLKRDPFTTAPVGGGFPSASAAKTTERITAIKDELRSVGALEVPSTPVAQTPAPPETDSGTKDLENYVWGAMLIVMVVFLCGFWLSNILIKHHSGSQGII